MEVIHDDPTEAGATRKVIVTRVEEAKIDSDFPMQFVEGTVE
jgi:hypothetical protein